MRFPALPSRNVVVARKYDRKDVHYRQAKKEGLRSRAGYKLEELDKRFGLFRKGMRVVDLGCWPGAWLQIASRRIGPEGVVVGVDLAISEALPGANVKILHGDASDAAVQAQIAQLLGGLPLAGDGGVLVGFLVGVCLLGCLPLQESLPLGLGPCQLASKV